MAQRVLFDRPARVGYLVLVLASCHGAPGGVVPAGAQPVSTDQVAQWVAGTVPKVVRTDRDGTIRLHAVGDRMWVE